MGKRMTREEFLEAVFSRRYEELKGRELRTVRVRVVGKELSLAQLIGVTDRRVYENLGLHIGTHLGVILLGSRAEVKSALEHVVEFFRTELGFTVCELTER